MSTGYGWEGLGNGFPMAMNVVVGLVVIRLSKY